MQYEIFIKPKAFKDGKKIPKKELKKIVDKIEALANNLHGDIKRLTNHTPEYRLRVGQYRILFEISDKTVVVYRILHRKDVYR